MSPLVSVIMPAYNAEKYIKEAINSVLNQTYRSFELIIVEDNSTDGTKEVLEEFQDNEKIRIFYNQENKGISYSTNRGIEYSRGKYIALLDDDDLAEPDRLEKQVCFMEQNEDIDICGGRTILIDADGNILNYSGIPRNNPKYIKSILLFNCMDFMNSTAIIRKHFIENNNLRYRENCYGMQDFKFYIEASKVGKISAMNEFLLRHRMHESNETERNLKHFSAERAAKYAEFQRESLEVSGYELEENELLLIHKAFAEVGGKCGSLGELNFLYKILCKLLSQAKYMKVDYYAELENLLNKKFAEQIIRVNIFKDIKVGK